MDQVADSVARVRARLALGLLLREGLSGLGWLCFGGGALALLLRRFWGLGGVESAIGLGLVLVLGLALLLWRLRPALPGSAAAARWLDLAGGGGGWVVCAEERPDPAWSDRAAAACSPRLPEVEARRPALVAGGGLAFVGLCLWVPMPGAAGDAGPEVVHPAEALNAQLDTLDSLVALPEEQLQGLEAELDSLAGADPRSESALESADAIADELTRAAEGADGAAGEALDALSGTADPTEALAAAATALGLGPGAESTLERGVPRVPEALTEALRQAADAAARGEKLESQPAKALADALQQALQETRTQLVEGRLVQRSAGAGQPGQGQPGQGQPGQGQPGEGQPGQGQPGAGQPGQGQPGQGQPGEGQPGAISSGAGTGGQSRGPGIAPLSFGETSSEEGVRFLPTTLPAARYADLEHSQLMQSGLAEPGADPRAEGTATGGAAGEGASAAERRSLSPSQRRSIGAFFGN